MTRIALRFAAACDRIAYVIGLASGGLFIAIGVIVFYGVIMRYLGMPQGWVDAYAIYFFLWGALLGAGHVTLTQQNIRVRLLVDRLPRQAAAALQVFTAVVIIAVAMVFVVLGYDQAATAFARGQTDLTVLRTPIWVLYAAIPVAGVFILLGGVRSLLEALALFGVPDHLAAKAQTEGFARAMSELETASLAKEG